MSPFDLEEAFHGSVTVGERGQVVIPASAREVLGISPGDKLLVFAPPGGHGVFFARLQDLQRMAAALGPLIQAISSNGAESPTAEGYGEGEQGGT